MYLARLLYLTYEVKKSTLHLMLNRQRLLPTLTLLACALGTGLGHAAPPTDSDPFGSFASNLPAGSPVSALANASTNSAVSAGDEMGGFLANKGLIEKLGNKVSSASRMVSDKASDLVVNAMGFLGVPYKRGGSSFDQGFDCSGFVKTMYEQTVGLVLPRRAVDQAAATQPIERSDLQPGDLVFFNTLKSAFSHVGIYVGDNKFIHSPRTGAVVRVEDMRVGYWSSRFNGARRVDTGLSTAQNTGQKVAAQITTQTPVQTAAKTAPTSIEVLRH